jgi:Na+:H+ antiporter, NhaA family
VPVFAFFAAGVSLADAGGLGPSLAEPVTAGIIAGLVVGKTLGVLGATLAVHRFSRAQLAPELSWWDVLGLSLLAGIGFTVSLLIGELAYGAGTELDNHVKIGVLLGSGIAALLAAVVLRIRDRHYRTIREQDTVDDDPDGLPDAHRSDEIRDP